MKSYDITIINSRSLKCNSSPAPAFIDAQDHQLYTGYNRINAWAVGIDPSRLPQQSPITGGHI